MTESANAKQPAQERLKRLQSNLKQLKDRKVDNERVLAKRSSTNCSNSASTSSSATFHTMCKAYEPRQSKGLVQHSLKITKTQLPVHSCSPSSRISVKDAWAKPKALLDASNRLERNHSISGKT